MGEPNQIKIGLRFGCAFLTAAAILMLGLGGFWFLVGWGQIILLAPRGC